MQSATTQYDRWGVWATLVWSALVMLGFAMVQAVFLGFYIRATTAASSQVDLQQEIIKLSVDGDAIALATLITAVCCVPMIIGIIRLKERSRLTDYLPITVPPRAELIRWLLMAAVLVLASDLISIISGNPVVPEFVSQAYASAHIKLLLWFALVVAGPLFEETLFRGFMISGFSPSWLGNSGAVGLSALAWALIHAQYNWYGIVTVFVFGIFLGTARVRTGSLLTPFVLHAAANAFATLEAAVS